MNENEKALMSIIGQRRHAAQNAHRRRTARAEPYTPEELQELQDMGEEGRAHFTREQWQTVIDRLDATAADAAEAPDESPQHPDADGYDALGRYIAPRHVIEDLNGAEDDDPALDIRAAFERVARGEEAPRVDIRETRRPHLGEIPEGHLRDLATRTFIVTRGADGSAERYREMLRREGRDDELESLVEDLRGAPEG